MASVANIPVMAIGPLLMADGANRGIDRSQNYLGPSAQPKSTIGPADGAFREHCPVGKE